MSSFRHKLSYYHQFLNKLNCHRYDMGCPPVWLDLEILKDFDQDPISFGNCFSSDEHRQLVGHIEHRCSDGFGSNPLFLSHEWTHLVVAMLEMHDAYILQLMLLRRPIAIDSVERGMSIDFSIVLLGNSISLWGIKTMDQHSSHEVAIYAPDKINKRKANDYIVSVAPCSKIEVLCVPRQEIQYGKARYYPSVPPESQVVYRCDILDGLQSTLNYIIQYANSKRMPFGRSKLTPLVVTTPTKTGSLFENTCPNVANNNSQVFTSSKESTLFSNSPYPLKPVQTRSKKRLSAKYMAQESYKKQPAANQQHPFLTASKGPMQLQKTVSERPPQSNNKPSLKKQMSVEWSQRSKQEPSNQRVHLLDNMARQQPTPISSQKVQQLQWLKEFIHQRHSRVSNCQPKSTEQIVLVSRQVEFRVNAQLMSRHSQVLESVIQTGQQHIIIDSFDQRTVQTLIHLLETPDQYASLLSVTSTSQAVELVGLLQYLQIGTNHPQDPLLLQKVVVFGLLSRSSAIAFGLAFRLALSPEPANEFWQRVAAYLAQSFKTHSKELLGDMDMGDVLASAPRAFVVGMVEQALMECQSINHLMDLLGVLTTCGYGSNIIEVLEKESEPYRHCSFVKLEQELPHLRPESAFLIEQHGEPNESRYGLLSFQQTQLGDVSSEVVTNYVLKVNGLRPKSRRWLIVGQQFNCLDRSWRLILQWQQDSLKAFVREVGRCTTASFDINFASCLVLIHCQLNRAIAGGQFFYSYSAGQMDTVGCELFRGCHFPQFSLEVKVGLRRSMIHSAVLHHLSIRWQDILKHSTIDDRETRRQSTDMAKRRSCAQLQDKLFEETEELIAHHSLSQEGIDLPDSLNSWIYRISQQNLYGLFSSDWLEVRDESLLLLYLSVYFLVKDRKSMPIAGLRPHLIPLKKMFEVGMNHPVLKNSHLFLTLVRLELDSRLQQSPNQQQRNRKHSRPLKQQQLTHELMELLRSDYIGTFKKKLGGLPAETPNSAWKAASKLPDGEASNQPLSSLTSSLKECSLF